MNKNENIEKKIGDAMSSLDGVGRATPKPFLLTRINARMSRQTETGWERAGSFLARPVYVIAGLLLLIGLNTMAVLLNPKAETETTTASEQLNSSPDDYVASNTTLYEIENTEP